MSEYGLYPAGNYPDPACSVCGETGGHTDWCRVLNRGVIREAWDFVSGHPCGVDKQFLEEIGIAHGKHDH